MFPVHQVLTSLLFLSAAIRTKNKSRGADSSSREFRTSLLLCFIQKERSLSADILCLSIYSDGPYCDPGRIRFQLCC